jgi:hypothetical protein
MDRYEICMAALIVFAFATMAGLLMASISALYCVDYACGVLVK